MSFVFRVSPSFSFKGNGGPVDCASPVYAIFYFIDLVILIKLHNIK